MPMDLIAQQRTGPYPVGLRSFELRDPNQSDRVIPVDVWYPGVPTDDDRAHPPADHPLKATHHARMNLDPVAGPLPLVLFSHGNSGYRRQSTFLTTHLASWGMVVAAPDHTGNTFFDSSAIRGEDQRKRVHFEARQNRPRDMAATARTLLNEPNAGWPEIDPNAVSALGHSYGGWTSLKLPGLDMDIRAVCVLAPASEPFVGRKAFAPGELPFTPAVPTLLIAGLDDVLVDIDTSIKPLFERMAPPCALVAIDRVDHFHFCDRIELLHGLHEANARPQATRPTRPYRELLQEEQMHPLLSAVVTSFFRRVFMPQSGSELDDPTAHLSAEGLAVLDPALRRIG